MLSQHPSHMRNRYVYQFGVLCCSGFCITGADDNIVVHEVAFSLTSLVSFAQENLCSWLLEPDCNDQYSVIHAGGEKVSVFTNTPTEPIMVKERPVGAHNFSTPSNSYPRSSFLKTS